MSETSDQSNLRHGYKSVQIGPKTLKIPLGWELTSLSPDEGGTEMVTDGSHYSPEHNQKDEYFYATVSDLTNFGINYESCGRINKEQFEEMVRAGCKPKPGDVLFSKDGTIGICTIFTEERDVVLLSSIAIIRPNTDIYLPAYLRYYLLSKLTTDQIRSLKSGTALRRVVLKDIKKFKIPTPPLTEQRRIAEILSTVDELIQQTDSVIEEKKRIKRGLMQDLLTQGIGHESFHQVQIGPEMLEIPEKWEINTIDDLTENLDSMREPIKSSDREDGNVPYYGATGKIDSVNNYIFNEELVLVGEDGANWSQFGGTAYIISGKSWVNNHVHVLRCQNINSVFISNYINYIDMRYIISGTNRGKLNQSELNRFSVPSPPLPEQRRIAEILSAVDESIQKEQQIKTKLEALRRGLMQNLLTGKVRVPIES